MKLDHCPLCSAPWPKPRPLIKFIDKDLMGERCPTCHTLFPLGGDTEGAARCIRIFRRLWRRLGIGFEDLGAREASTIEGAAAHYQQATADAHLALRLAAVKAQAGDLGAAQALEELAMAIQRPFQLQRPVPPPAWARKEFP